MKVVKSVLVIAHENADVERGLSDSGKNETDGRVRLSEPSVNAIRLTTDDLKMYGGKPHAVPVNNRLLTLGGSAHRHYTQMLDEQRMKVEAEKKEKAIREEEKKLQEEQGKDLARKTDRLKDQEQTLLKK